MVHRKEELMKIIRVLVIDDSHLFRQLLTKALSSDACIEVVGTAVDPYEARDKILALNPDVLTCDIEMPKMNGLEFISKLMPQFPLPVVVVSSLNKNVFEVMSAGAVDFVQKPDLKVMVSVEAFVIELLMKVKIASMANVSHWKKQNYQKIIADTFVMMDKRKHNIIAIGSSTGGTEALTYILKLLPRNIPGIVVVQHIPPIFSRMFAERLNQCTPFYVKEAETGDYVEEGKVLIAPGDRHMRVKKKGMKYEVECVQGDRVNGHCPSVDVLFESVASEAKKSAIGIILTGMGYDGAKGLLEMRKQGARTIGQDEASSVVYGMPQVAFNIGGVEKQVALEEIPHQLYKLLVN